MRSFARTTGAAVYGARASLVDVEASIAGLEEGGDPFFRIVGLPDSALREGRDRIRSAVRHGGWPWPCHPLIVNLAPASARKEGPALDLAIALAILGAEGAIPDPSTLETHLFLGELSLDATVRPVRGVLAALEAGRAAGLRRALVPRENAEEAAAVVGVESFAVGDLGAALGHLSGFEPLPRLSGAAWEPEPWEGRLAAEVRGQPLAVRCALIAAAGGHNLLMTGAPGAGKTLLARAMVGLMPPLTYEEALEASRIHSIAGRLEGGLLRRRPFRAPHHTTSLAGLVGGGTVLRAGEISLAHLGVLFLDELAEFPRGHLEALRQPVEDGRLVLARAAGRETFPADVLLVAATNPCPCGWKGVRDRCRCNAAAVERYAARLSGPLRDRFDLQVVVKPVAPDDLLAAGGTPGVEEAVVRAARERQAERARRLGTKRQQNARIPGKFLPDAVDPTPEAREFLARRAEGLGLTGRGIHRSLRVARTIADLAGDDRVRVEHVEEAMGYRDA